MLAFDTERVQKVYHNKVARDIPIERSINLSVVTLSQRQTDVTAKIVIDLKHGPIHEFTI